MAVYKNNNGTLVLIADAGGSGGTTDYADLTNKPQINGVTLTGNKTTQDLNISYDDLQNKPYIPSAQIQSDWDQSDNTKADYIKNKPTLGTAAAKNVPSAGNASLTEVVMGSDSRLSDDRNAKDVYSWAKSATKPTYNAAEVGAIPSTDKGANGGVAELDSNGLVPASQLPSYVDDVLEGTAQNVTETGAGTYSATGFILSGESSPCVPESGKTYVDTTSNIQYRWTGTGTNFVSMGSNLALGETSSTAYRGDRGKTAYDHSQTTGNLHNTTKSDVGLGNVPNVSTNDQTPTFTEASTRNNIASGEKLSVILGKIQKFFNDLKSVAFSGSYADLSNKPQINSVELSGNKIASDLGLAGITDLANKVDKEAGKGLSTNDYTNTDKANVAKVSEKADKTATATGETLSLVPTSEGRALIHTAYGMSVQDGTPTPSEPVDIVSAKVNFRSVGKNLIPYPYTDASGHLDNGITFNYDNSGKLLLSGTNDNINESDITLSLNNHDTTTDLTLRAIEVTSSDAYNLVRDGKYYIADTIDYSEDNGFVVTRRVGALTFDGSDDTNFAIVSNYVSSDKRLTYSNAIIPSYQDLGYSNAWHKGSINSNFLPECIASANQPYKSVETIGLHLSNHNIQLYIAGKSSVVDYMAAFVSNPLNVIYRLATPTTESITTAQALALLGLKTYDESTTISSQAEPACTIAVEYAKERLGALALTAYNTAKGNDLRITALEA